MNTKPFAKVKLTGFGQCSSLLSDAKGPLAFKDKKLHLFYTLVKS